MFAKETRYFTWSMELMKKQDKAAILGYCVVIIGVSILDMYFTQRYAISLPQMEINPIARWIMRLDEMPSRYGFYNVPDVSAFLCAKAAGTCVVVGIVATLVIRAPRYGHTVGLSLSILQVCLLGYLLF